MQQTCRVVWDVPLVSLAVDGNTLEVAVRCNIRKSSKKSDEKNRYRMHREGEEEQEMINKGKSGVQ